MGEAFEATVRGLFARLDLPPPSFAAGGRVVLRVDASEVELFESPDGRNILIEGVAGALPADPFAEGERLRAALRTNLGFLVGNRAGVFLGTGAGGAAELRVQAAYAYALRDTETLMKRIDDVLQLLEYHAADFAPRAAPAPRSARRDGDFGEDFFIIRP